MDRLLARLERRFGRHVPSGLTYLLVCGQVIVFVLSLTNPGLLELLQLDRTAILHGQVWRLVSYVFIPPFTNVMAAVFEIYLLYTMGHSLEVEWGPVKYLVFWLVGMIGTTAFAFGLNIPASNEYLLLSLFLAFATLWPDYELRLLFLIPVKVKWLALLAGCALLGEIGMHDGLQKALPLVAIGNYLLFFTPSLLQLARNAGRRAGRVGALHQFKREAREANGPQRVCTLCGVTDADPDAEFRVCSCEKCGTPTEFCLAHARSH
jgi:hypothetical protein